MKTIRIAILASAGVLTAATVNYSYDAAGRLTTIDYGAGGSISYSYDAAGNMTSRVVQAGTSSSVIVTARLSRDAATIELVGTNLAPLNAEELAVTVDGHPAKVLKACSANSKACREDRVVVANPGMTGGKVRVVVNTGRSSAEYWLSARENGR